MYRFFLLCALTLAQATNAEVIENLVYRSYTANAEPARSLLAILNAASPYQQGGQIYHAYTKWHVSWRYRWLEKPDGRCSMTSVTTKVDGDIHLPRLTGANPAQNAQFERYLAALRTHELGHYRIGVEAANVVDKRIMALGEMASCAALEALANERGHATINEYKNQERRYDQSTGHGKTQGAWLDD